MFGLCITAPHLLLESLHGSVALRFSELLPLGPKQKEKGKDSWKKNMDKANVVELVA